MPHLIIDGEAVTAPHGSTVLEAARARGARIPTLCTRNGLRHVTSCMVCLVEDADTGALIPACSAPASEGMRIHTTGDAVTRARRAALELLLSDHVGDCEGPCRRGCPAGMDIPTMLRHIAAGRLTEAIRVVREHIALPAVLGRICPAPCEKVCRRGALDTPVGICALKRHVADEDLRRDTPSRPDLAPDSGQRVAVVGAGPAGLAAAFELRRRGHAVTLYEARAAPGGGLREAMRKADAPAAVLDAEIDRILGLGIAVHAGVVLGSDIALPALRDTFDAVLLAVGSLAPGEAARLGLPPGPHGVAADRHTGQTAMPGVFACGNATAPGHMAVRALAHGRAAAIGIDQHLRGQPVTGPTHPYDHRIPGRPAREEVAELRPDAATAPRAEAADRPNDVFDKDEARTEADRCLHCDCGKRDTCRLRRYADAYRADPHAWKPPERRRVTIQRSSQVLYEPGKCIACGICVRLTEKAREPLGLAFIGRGFDVRVGVPFGETLDEGLRTVAAECIAACPTGALDHGRRGNTGRTEGAEGRDGTTEYTEDTEAMERDG